LPTFEVHLQQGHLFFGLFTVYAGFHKVPLYIPPSTVSITPVM
jgi:hypothetical protein